jgi:hypothetical protein
MFKEIGWDGVDWIDVAQNRKTWRVYVIRIMNLGVSQNARNFLLVEGGIIRFSRKILLHGVGYLSGVQTFIRSH